METNKLRAAALAVGHKEPISIEPDGTIWLGIDSDRIYLTAEELKTVNDQAVIMEKAAVAARVSARTKLAALGLTEAEIGALLGS